LAQSDRPLAVEQGHRQPLRRRIERENLHARILPMSFATRRVQSAPLVMTEFSIESLDQEGRGVAHADGKVVFVEGALPGERVQAEIVRRKPSYDIARAVLIDGANASRTTPRCPHFGVCGGCTLQHADPAL